MKKIIFCMAAMALFMLSGKTMADEQLLKSVPKGANFVVSVDFKKVLDLPLINELRTTDAEFDQKYEELELKLKAAGLKVKDVADDAVLFAFEDGKFGALVNTKVKEAQLTKLLQDNLVETGAAYSTKTVDGKKVHIIQQTLVDPLKAAASGGYAPKEDKVFAAVYMNANTVLITEEKNLKALQDGMKKGSITSDKAMMAKKSGIEKGAVCWAIFQMPKMPAAPQGAPANPIQQIKGGSISIALQGKKSEDVALALALSCADAQSASQLAMQAQFGLMAIGASLKDDPQLAMEVTQAIKIKPEKSSIVAKMLLTKVLQDKLKAYNEKYGNN